MTLAMKHNITRSIGTFILAIGLFLIPSILHAADVTSVTPTLNAQGVLASSDIVVTFDATIDAAAASNATFRVSGSQTGAILGFITGGGTNTLTFNPLSNFRAGEVITVTLTPALGLTAGYSWQFTVAAAAYTPNFVSRTQLGLAPTSEISLYPADMDKDGDTDIVAVSIGGLFTLYENIGNASFTARNIASVGAIASVHGADMDGDSDMDILVALAGSIAWFENTGALTFVEHTVQNESASFVRAADIDNDGDMDVVAAAGTSKTINWYENIGQVFTAHTIPSNVTDANCVAVADLDGDGDMDIMSSYTDKTNAAPNGGVAWHENKPAGFVTHDIVTANPALSVYPADMDSDGDLDVVSCTQNRIFWYENSGAQTFTDHAAVSTGIHQYSIHVADQDGDGDMDILAGNQPNISVYWYENNGLQTFTQRSVSNIGGNGLTSIFAVDIDGDGDLDVTAASVTDGRVGWFSNNQRPVIADAVAGQTVDDYSTISPFTAITVTDRDAGQRQLAQITLDNSAKGSFTAASLTASGFTRNGAIYNFVGTAAAVQAALRLLVFAPAAGRMPVGNSETVTFTVTVNDNVSTTATNNVTTVIVTAITPPNAAPSFTRGADVEIDEDVPAQSIGWATNISAGPASESGQSVSFTVNNDNTGLFTTQPAMSATGVLTFQPAPNAWGNATVTVVLTDDGGTANGGVNQSTPIMFIITVHPVNDAPRVNPVGPITMAAGVASAELTLTGLHPGLLEETQTLTLTVTSATPSILPNPSVTLHAGGTATVLLVPTPGASGTVTVTLVIRDDGGTDRSGQDQTVITFTVTIEKTADPDPDPVPDPDPTVQTVFIPTLFSPNGDGSNDVLRVRAGDVADIRFCVYSADGHEVFRTTNITEATESGWNGLYGGREMPAGTYTWTLSGHFTDGNALTFGNRAYGQVVLLR